MASNHYVNNAHMLAAIKKYKLELQDARDKELEKPRMPEYLGECILKIATHLAYKPNFYNYSYKDDMILDGIENAIMVIDSFDPEKSSNPFAYFTQVIYYAFLRRIAKEKKQSYIRAKIIQNMPFESFELQDQDEDGEFTNAYMAFIQSHQNFDDSFEKKKEKVKVLKKKNGLEELIDPDSEVKVSVEDIIEEVDE